MGSESSATEVTEDTTTNIAVDRRAVQESGSQILDSIIVDNSTETVKAAMQTLEASWRTMVQGNAMNLVEVAEIGGEILKYADKSQIKLEGVAYQTLKNGLKEFELMMRQGTLAVELAETVATHAIDANTELSTNALDVVAEVATGDAADNLKVISLAVMVFAMGAIYLATRKE
jgi:hypothetical protein